MLMEQLGKMKIKILKPDEIITLNDFPLHSEQVLKLYFIIYQKGCGKIIPAIPVLPIELVISSLDKKIRVIFDNFIKKNKQAKYFMLDGSHKTTAATLTGAKISVMIFNSNNDIKEAKSLLKSGKLLGLSVGDSIKNNISILNKHFSRKMYFETVEDKTKRMVKEKVIPSFMIEWYKRILR